MTSADGLGPTGREPQNDDDERESQGSSPALSESAQSDLGEVPPVSGWSLSADLEAAGEAPIDLPDEPDDAAVDENTESEFDNEGPAFDHSTDVAADTEVAAGHNVEADTGAAMDLGAAQGSSADADADADAAADEEPSALTQLLEALDAAEQADEPSGFEQLAPDWSQIAKTEVVEPLSAEDVDSFAALGLTPIDDSDDGESPASDEAPEQPADFREGAERTGTAATEPSFDDIIANRHDTAADAEDAPSVPDALEAPHAPDVPGALDASEAPHSSDEGDEAPDFVAGDPATNPDAPNVNGANPASVGLAGAGLAGPGIGSADLSDSGVPAGGLPGAGLVGEDVPASDAPLDDLLVGATPAQDTPAPRAPKPPKRAPKPQPDRIENPVERARQLERQQVLTSRHDTDDAFAQSTIDTVRGWLSTLASDPAKKTAHGLEGLLQDPKGLQFARDFIDRVVRPDDAIVSARNLERLSRSTPEYLSWQLKAAIAAGGGFGILAPKAVIPSVRRSLRRVVSHFVLDARPQKLAKQLAALHSKGASANLAPVTDLGPVATLSMAAELLQRDDVPSVSVRIDDIIVNPAPWDFDGTVTAAVELLLPLYRVAASASTPKRVHLDLGEYAHHDLTFAVFERLLAMQEFGGLELGITVQAYLPEAKSDIDKLVVQARARRDRGGAPIRIHLVKGANLAMERAHAVLQGWPQAVLDDKDAIDANFRRLLEHTLIPEHAAVARVGVGSHNLFDLAYAVRVADSHGTREVLEAEILLGMADDHIEVIKNDFPRITVSAPAVLPEAFSAASDYLVRRFDESSSGDHIISTATELADSTTLWGRELQRFLASTQLLKEQDSEGTAPSAPFRTQNRAGSLDVSIANADADSGVVAEPLTDPALAANRAWATQLFQRAAKSTQGEKTVELNLIEDVETLSRRIQRTREAQPAWAAKSANERARSLRDAAVTVGAYRGRLIETMMSEIGMTLADADGEVSAAVDALRAAAEQTSVLTANPGAIFVPATLSVVASAWSAPITSPAQSIGVALAAGSAVIVSPAPEARRAAAVLLEALWEAGVPRDVLVLCAIDDGPVSEYLITAPEVDRVLLTGSSATAGLFLSWKPDLRLLADASGSNSVIVTSSADIDAAVHSIVAGAFRNAGQSCTAISSVILVGPPAHHERFLKRLATAVSALVVGDALDPKTQIGPLIAPPRGALLAALTSLSEGESWLVTPNQRNAEGTLWSPGVRRGVTGGTFTHVTELFGPHLAILEAKTLDEAITLQNATSFGLLAGLYSLDQSEVEQWLQNANAGSLLVNGEAGQQRPWKHPLGGWKGSHVGPGAKLGGPNGIVALGSWSPQFTPPRKSIVLSGLDQAVAAVVEAATPKLDFLEFDRVRTAAENDESVWRSEFGIARDLSALGVERNVIRYVPANVLIRLTEHGTMGQLVRLLAAAARARATIRISSAVALPSNLVQLAELDEPLLNCEQIVIENDAEFRGRLRNGSALARLQEESSPGTWHDVPGAHRVHRVRIAGEDALLRRSLQGNPAITLWDGEITTSGRVELLPFLREQSVSLAAHRYGHIDPHFADMSLRFTTNQR